MHVQTTGLSGVLVLTPDRFEDERGTFSESWNKSRLAAAGLDHDFVQDNHSVSIASGTIRGLHMQVAPQAQVKLVRCVRGAILDVAVDVRSGSPTYGRWIGVALSPENGKQLLIPTGVLHGFVTRVPRTEVMYKCSAYYSPQSERSVRYDDPDIGIDWGLSAPPVLSKKDASALPLSALHTGAEVAA